MKWIRIFLSQAAVICCFVCIITKILDWYNPYMNFSGRVWYIEYFLYIAVLLLAVLPSRIRKK